MLDKGSGSGPDTETNKKLPNGQMIGNCDQEMLLEDDEEVICLSDEGTEDKVDAIEERYKDDN